MEKTIKAENDIVLKDLKPRDVFSEDIAAAGKESARHVEVHFCCPEPNLNDQHATSCEVLR